MNSSDYKNDEDEADIVSGLYENVYATAAEYDEKSDRLTVAFHSSNDVLTSSGSLCLFQMGDINNAFENVWNNCQNTTFVESTDVSTSCGPQPCLIEFPTLMQSSENGRIWQTVRRM